MPLDRNKLVSAGKQVPPPVLGHMLVDTGAHSSCISAHTAQALGLRPISRVKGFGAGGQHENDVVFARLIIAIENNSGLTTTIWWDRPYQAIPEMEHHLPHVVSGGSPIVLTGLLGRDILRLATLIYNGKKGTLEMMFDPEWVRSRDKSGS